MDECKHKNAYHVAINGDVRLYCPDCLRLDEGKPDKRRKLNIETK